MDFFFRKTPFTYWLNGRWFLQIVERDSCNLYTLYPLFPCSDFVSQMWGWFGGGSVMFFLTFYAISNISRKKIWEYKTIISHLMFCFFVFFVCWKYCKCPFTYSYWLNGRWFLQIVDIGNFIMRLEIIEKFPFTYWLNGRWFLQIVDIHVGNFNMKLTGRWFPQIVDRDSGNLYPIYI